MIVAYIELPRHNVHPDLVLVPLRAIVTIHQRSDGQILTDIRF